MSFIKKTIVLGILAAAAAGGGFAWWARQPIITEEPPIDFTIVPGSGAHAAGRGGSQDTQHYRLFYE